MLNTFAKNTNIAEYQLQPLPTTVTLTDAKRQYKNS